MRETSEALALVFGLEIRTGIGILISAVFVAGASHAQQPELGAPPDAGAICPAIDEDFRLCAEDLMSGNCPDFVAAAGALGRLYRFNVAREPDQTERFRSTIWWQCGSKNLVGIKDLLLRIGSPAARAVLASEPYPSLPSPRDIVPAVRPPPTAPPADCDAAPSETVRAACEADALTAAEAAHRRVYEGCEQTLPDALRSELVSGEHAWRASLEIECTDKPCLSEAIEARDVAIQQAYPECGPRDPGVGFVSHEAEAANTGMLPAQWTPKGGTPQPVPFTFEARNAKRGTMSTTLGKGGEQFHGTYVRVEFSTKDHLVTEIYNGFSSPEWEEWQHDPGGAWTATGVSFGDFANFYTGKVVAALEGDRGTLMRCQFTLTEPASGLAGGGSGACQTSHGGRISLQF